MDDEEQTLAERMFRGLVIQLLKSGKVDEDDLFQAADALDAEGDEDAAYQLRILPVEAAATPQSDWEAHRRRESIRLVADGGNKAE